MLGLGLGQSTINDATAKGGGVAGTGHHQAKPQRSPAQPNVQAKGLPCPQPDNPYPFSPAPLGGGPKRVCFKHRRGKGLPSVFNKMRNHR